MGTLRFSLILSLGALLARAQSVGYPYAAELRRSDLTGPSASDWQCLNNSLDGRLIAGVPVAHPCFTDASGSESDVFNSEECQFVRSNYNDEVFRSNSPGGFINTQWETCQVSGEQCLLNFTNPSDVAAVRPPFKCSLGSIPGYFINVTGPSDISEAFSFSRQTGVRVVVKNTGHDYKGRSSAPGSLALWTHNLKNITYNPSFVPDGCNTSFPAATLGAGVQFREIYAFAEENNFTFVGGSDSGVGSAGGWLQGGGHGALSNQFGMGVDRVLQFKLVTPDGRYRVANACQNKDLFFALRGGGGGTYGVVLEATSLVSPPVTLQVAGVILSETNATLTKSLWSIIVDNALRWTEEGWGSFVSAESALFVTPALNSSAANSSMAPLLEFGMSLQNSGLEGVQVVSEELPSWATFFNKFAKTDSAEIGANLALASRLVPKENFETEASRQQLLEALLNASSTTGGVRFIGSTPFNFPGDGGTSITEAWRNSVYHITLISTWNYNATLAEKQEKYSLATKAIDFVRALTPDAAYSNEAHVHEPNHEVTFWGTHYEELLAIKNKYDPDGLLDCWQCVGWQPTSPQFSCYV